MVIIGLSAKMCTGKTTLANNICKDNPKFVRISLSEGVYERYNREKSKVRIGKDRRRLQEIAEDAKSEDPDVWVKTCMMKAKSLISSGNNVIIDDVRFENEVKAITRAGGTCIRLLMRDNDRCRMIEKTYPDNFMEHIKSLNHISETALDDHKFAFTVNVSNRFPKTMMDLLSDSCVDSFHNKLIMSIRMNNASEVDFNEMYDHLYGLGTYRNIFHGVCDDEVLRLGFKVKSCKNRDQMIFIGSNIVNYLIRGTMDVLDVNEDTKTREVGDMSICCVDSNKKLNLWIECWNLKTLTSGERDRDQESLHD